VGTHRFWLAQANIARMRAPLEDPIMSGFVAQLDEINSVADQSPGFIWRLQTSEGDATAIRVFDDDRILFNLSVWESIEALKRYVYAGRHGGTLRDRRQWFERLDGPALVLWWIGEGHTPSVEEAKERLEMLKLKGPTQDAFTFKHLFRAPGVAHTEPLPVDVEACDWEG
jgi:hypothetical protein